MSRWLQTAPGAYRRLLRLYPAAFRDSFAEEMAWVFALALEETAKGGSGPVVRMLAREIGELPVSIFIEHLHERRKDAMRLLIVDLQGDIRRFRWGARLLSILPIAFFLLIILGNEDVRAEPAPALLIQGLLTLALAAAWRWEKEGGTILMAGAPILMLLYILSALRFNFTFIPAVLVAGSVALPYLLIGWLFYSVGRHSLLVAPVQSEKRPAQKKRSLLLVAGGLSLLAVITIILFVVALVTPASEGQISTIPAGPCTAVEDRVRGSFAIAAPASPLPNSLKGYEMYSYQREGEWFFTFEVGLNRIRSAGDAPAAIEGTGYTVQGLDQLRLLLNQIPTGEDIIWCGYERPAEDVVQELAALSDDLGLRLTILGN